MGRPGGQYRDEQHRVPQLKVPARVLLADGLTLRHFADFYCDPVPKHDVFNRSFNRLTAVTQSSGAK